MDHPGFWAPAGSFSLAELASYTGAEIPEASLGESGKSLRSVKALDDAGGSDVSFFDNRKYLAALKQTRAAAVFVSANYVSPGSSDLRSANLPRSLSRIRQIAGDVLSRCSAS